MITLPKHQLDWLTAQVAAGRFPSIESAIEAAMNGLMADTEDNGDDELKTLLDDARGEAETIGAISLEDFKAHVRRRQLK